MNLSTREPILQFDFKKLITKRLHSVGRRLSK